MIISNKVFFKYFGLLYISVCLLILALTLTGYTEWQSDKIWSIQIFFLVIFVISHLISNNGLKNITEFHIYYMASMGIRFLGAIVYLFINIFFMKEGHILFVVDFFILYFLYTSFEIYFLLRNLQPDSKKDT